ncbi:AraC family transcriptional regulator [Acinetobacter sp. ANC 4633]|uniref:AraC family transcriptional regulator n=1 Tax=Acinetobacter sp. ANC 4633 TaxID=2529845 RepID=UPI00148EE006|nr:AraC family transcriptional regulator [Acinetobacter sp. ANC 4633]
MGLNEILGRSIAQWTQGQHHVQTPITGLSLSRWEQPNEPTSYVMDASLCLIAQGQKQVMLSQEIYTYDASHFLFTAVDFPVIAQITEASPERPYLSVLLKLDPHLLAQIMLEAQISFQPSRRERKGVAVGTLTPDMLSAFIRLINLLNTPQDIAVLAPLIIKEIFYRLLISPQGERLKQIVTMGTTGHRIIRAIDWIKHQFTQPLRVEELAKSMGMSVSSFHQHFRDITSMSPLQYQKSLRLTEARRLLMTENRDISSASLQVGYESLSQFSREYKRFFGAPPSEDIKHLSLSTFSSQQ